MNTTTHPVAPEEVMALLDGELSAAEAQALTAHIEHCAECRSLAEQFRSTSQLLSSWEVSAVPESVEDATYEGLAKLGTTRKSLAPKSRIRGSSWSWSPFAVGSAGVVAALFLLVIFSRTVSPHRRHMLALSAPPAAIEHRYAYQNAATRNGPMPSPTADALSARLDALSSSPMSGAPRGTLARGGGGDYIEPKVESKIDLGPMIARTVSLTITVKDLAAARTSLDLILGRHHGYSANVNVNTPRNASPNFGASLRVPAGELPSTLIDIRGLGYVDIETQSAEEVTQQHADLAARLKTARETEERFQSILQQRTGNVAEVLQVEEGIARVRGEIEGMETDQAALEHRVVFASIDLQLTEEYREQLNIGPGSASGRMHNALVAGLRNAAATSLGIMLFLEEYGPSILIWLVMLGAPIVLAVWLRRRIKSREQ